MIKPHRFLDPGNLRKGSVDSAMTDGRGAFSVRLEEVEEEPVPLSPSLNISRDLPGTKTRPRRTGAQLEYTPVTRIEKTDPIWSMYVKEAHARDREMLEAWSTNMDVLLVFAGLFSAILTAFLVELHKDLKESPADRTNEFLAAVVQRLDYLGDNSTGHIAQPFEVKRFNPLPESVRVNFYWFGSLTFSLLAAAGAMLAKQWFREYSRNSTTGSHYDQAHIRQERFDGLAKWRFREVVDLLPTLMHIALILFFVGLIDFLWVLYRPIAILTMVLFLCGITFAFTTTFLAMYAPNCPYRTPLTATTANFFQVLIRWSQMLQRSHSGTAIEVLTRTATLIGHLGGKGTLHCDPVKHDDLEALVWLLRESRYEETVRASLKLVPAVSTSIERRDQMCKLGAITRLCELFDPSHPDYHRIVERDRDAIAFGLALRSLLAEPRPEIPKSLMLPDVVRLPLDYMTNHPNINLHILASSFMPLNIIDVYQPNGAAVGWTMVDEVAKRGSEVSLWARILFLDTLREWMVFIRENAPPGLVRKPENTPVVILEFLTRVACAAPDRHITLELLAALLSSMTVTLGAPDSTVASLHIRTSEVALGLCLKRCLQEMHRNKLADGQPTTPGIDHTNAPAIIPLSDVEQSLVHLLTIVNQLLPRFPTMFGSSWSSAICMLIDFAHDSADEGAIDMTLQTLLLCKHEILGMSCSPTHNQRLLTMCIVRPDTSRFDPIPDDVFLDILKLMEYILPSLENVEMACQVLLDNPDSLAPLFVQGLRRDDNEIHMAIMRITDYVFENSQSNSDIIDLLADSLVEAGLLKELFALVKRTPFGAKLAQIVRPVGWLARSSSSGLYLSEDSALRDLVAITQDMKSHWGKDYAARAIILLWDSACKHNSETERNRLTQQIIDSGFLSTLSSWFESDNVGDSLYKSYQELHSVWLGLLKGVFELQPAALMPPLKRQGSHPSLAPSPLPRGLVTAIINHLALTINTIKFASTPQSEQETVGDLLEDLKDLEDAISVQVEQLRSSTSS